MRQLLSYFWADPSYAAELLAKEARDGDAGELAVLDRPLSAAFATSGANPAS